MIHAIVVTKVLFFITLVIVPPFIAFSWIHTFFCAHVPATAYLRDFAANLVSAAIAIPVLAVTARLAGFLWR